MDIYYLCLPQTTRAFLVRLLTVAAGVLLMGASMVWLVIHFGVRMQNWAIDFMVSSKVTGKAGESIVVRDTLGAGTKGGNLDLEIQNDRVPEK
jgi:hypothetical protein